VRRAPLVLSITVGNCQGVSWSGASSAARRGAALPGGSGAAVERRAHPTDTTLVPSQTGSGAQRLVLRRRRPQKPRRRRRSSAPVSWTRTMGAGEPAPRWGPTAPAAPACVGPVSQCQSVTRAHEESTPSDLVLPKKTGSMSQNPLTGGTPPS
jgi:hypothetical protein